MEIKDHNGIFVGGASGMCRATANIFKEKGGNIAILDLPSSDGAAVAKELGGSFHEVNVMDWEGTETAINEAVASLGSVHFCCNSAGGGLEVLNRNTLTTAGVLVGGATALSSSAQHRSATAAVVVRATAQASASSGGHHAAQGLISSHARTGRNSERSTVWCLAIICVR